MSKILSGINYEQNEKKPPYLTNATQRIDTSGPKGGLTLEALTRAYSVFFGHVTKIRASDRLISIMLLKLRSKAAHGGR